MMPSSSSFSSKPGGIPAPAFKPSRTLVSAWARQRVYSRNARAAQNRFFAFRLSILVLSVLATVLAVTHAELKAHLGETQEVVLGVKYSLLVVPIMVTALVAGAIRFDRGQNWVLLRGNSEALKREIYYYRTKVFPYNDTDRDAKLADRIKVFSERLKGTEVNRASFNPGEREIETEEEKLENEKRKALFSDLTAEDYLAQRLEAQFDWYRTNTKILDRQSQWLEWLTYGLGGAGTLLAATGLETWVAVSSALVAAFTSFLEFKRVEDTLIGYNQAADNLYNVRALWQSLPESKRDVTLLVKTTEEIIQGENASWLQDMQDRLADLYSRAKTDEEVPHHSTHNVTADATVTAPLPSEQPTIEHEQSE